MVVLLLFAGWTGLVWGTRVSNILADDGAGSGAGPLVVAVGMTALAAAVVLHAVGGRARWAVPALAAATVAVWAVRVPTLLLGDRGAAFVAVHLVLAGVSLALAYAATRSPRRTSRASVRQRTAPPALRNSDTSATATSKPHASS